MLLIKNSVTEKKNVFDGFISSAKERISEPKDITIKTSKIKKNKNKNRKTKRTKTKIQNRISRNDGTSTKGVTYL